LAETGVIVNLAEALPVVTEPIHYWLVDLEAAVEHRLESVHQPVASAQEARKFGCGAGKDLGYIGRSRVGEA